MTIICAIESSCDETGVGIAELSDDGTVTLLADEVASSVDEHARFGGVVPEIASRAHLEAMPQVMEKALADAGIDKPDAVAATVGPGLAGALLVGASAAKAYAAAWGVPFYGVNHLGGHVAVANLAGESLPHAVALLVSIFKARPSPFYIMDEVEAALDDTNLGRLIMLFEELRDSSQLIVITHQKRTMEVADALYGVSMRGDGVTTVVSQRIRDVAATA